MMPSPATAQRLVNMGGKMIPVTSKGQPDINSILANYTDRGIWSYYYTVKIAAGVQVGTQYNFFGASIGQADPYPLTTPAPTLTKLETNIPNANFFNPPRDLILDQLGFHFEIDTRLPDIQSFTKNCFFEFKIDDKIFFEGKLWMHPPGTGVSGVTTQTAEGTFGLGIPNMQATFRFGNFAKYIAPLQRYSLVLYFPEFLPTLLPSTGPQGAAPGIWIIAFLKGLTDRAVQ
jgi:hypothetical protein